MKCDINYKLPNGNEGTWMNADTGDVSPEDYLRFWHPEYVFLGVRGQDGAQQHGHDKSSGVSLTEPGTATGDSSGGRTGGASDGDRPSVEQRDGKKRR